MANKCNYNCRIVGKTRESVQQIINAMRQKDFKNGYYLCRIFSADQDNDIIEKDWLFYAEIHGDCAWSVSDCMIDDDYFKWRGANIGEPKFCVFRNWREEICYNNIAMTMPMLCKALNCGVEIWSDECGLEFQEHYIINHEGELVEADTTRWVQGYNTDENGDFVDYNPEKDEGGFEDYGTFSECDEIFNAGK